MVSTLAWNAKDVGLIPALGTIFPIVIRPMTLVAMTMIFYSVVVCTDLRGKDLNRQVGVGIVVTS